MISCSARFVVAEFAATSVALVVGAVVLAGLAGVADFAVALIDLAAPVALLADLVVVLVAPEAFADFVVALVGLVDVVVLVAGLVVNRSFCLR